MIKLPRKVMFIQKCNAKCLRYFFSCTLTVNFVFFVAGQLYYYLAFVAFIIPHASSERTLVLQKPPSPKGE